MNHEQAVWAMVGVIAGSMLLSASGWFLGRRLRVPGHRRPECGGCAHWGPSELRDMRDHQGRVGFCGFHGRRTRCSDACEHHRGVGVSEPSFRRFALEMGLLAGGFYVAVYLLFVLLWPWVEKLLERL
jgi:hypothetical protein